jgi:cytochrome c oxidase subunit 3
VILAHSEAMTHEEMHGPEAAHEALQHHFENMEQQREAGTLGMWVFLITEIMFFGGMFLAYIIYRTQNQAAFAAGSHHLDVVMGGVNTIVLIVSSLTMALAVWSTQVGRPRRTQVMFLLVTMALGTTFLVIKAFEYWHKFEDGLVPARGLWHPTAEIVKSFGNVDLNKVQMFYWIYFAMTGLHALHMIIGLGIMSVLVWQAWRNRYSPEYHAPVEISGLYWHFVDIVWIFLFPLLYLLGAHVGKGH